MSQCGPYSNHQPVWHWVKPLAAPIAVLKRKSRLWRVIAKLTFSMSSCLRRKAYPPLFPPANHYEEEYLCTFMVSTHMHAKSKKWAVEETIIRGKTKHIASLGNSAPHISAEYPPFTWSRNNQGFWKRVTIWWVVFDLGSKRASSHRNPLRTARNQKIQTRVLFGSMFFFFLIGGMVFSTKETRLQSPAQQLGSPSTPYWRIQNPWSSRERCLVEGRQGPESGESPKCLLKDVEGLLITNKNDYSTRAYEDVWTIYVIVRNWLWVGLVKPPMMSFFPLGWNKNMDTCRIFNDFPSGRNIKIARFQSNILELEASDLKSCRDFIPLHAGPRLRHSLWNPLPTCSLQKGLSTAHLMDIVFNVFNRYESTAQYPCEPQNSR